MDVVARRKVMGLSVPPELYDEYNQLAREENRTKSELFREMIRVYKYQKKEQEFVQLQKEISAELQKKGILSEEDVDKIVFEDR